MAPLSSLHGIVWHWHCVARRLGCADPLCDVGKLLPRVFPPAWPKKNEEGQDSPNATLGLQTSPWAAWCVLQSQGETCCSIPHLS